MGKIIFLLTTKKHKLTMNRLAILASIVVSTNAYIGDYKKLINSNNDDAAEENNNENNTTQPVEEEVEEDDTTEEDLLDETEDEIDEEEMDRLIDAEIQMEQGVVGERNNLDDDADDAAPEEAETSNEEAEPSDPMTD